MKHKPNLVSYGLSLLTATAALIGAAGPLQAQDKKPNILVIMGDDIGWFNIGAYHRGIMSGKTPTSTSLRRKACCSPTTTPRQAVRRAEPTLSPAKFPYARV